jgi:nucleoside-diphosphate-sugar epimerase
MPWSIDQTVRSPQQTVLVMGAAGYIGSCLTRRLVQSASITPIGLMRRVGRASPPNIEMRICDATRQKELAIALRGVDTVVNCVGGGSRAMIRTTTALYNVARRQPLRRIVHLSSMAIYGSAAGLVTETTLGTPPLNHYARAKLVCEQLTRDYVRDGGDAVILRPSCVFGPGDELWAGRLARLLRARRIGDLGPSGDGICNLIYVDDLVEAIVSVISAQDVSGEAFNVSDPSPLTWNEFLIRFARAIGTTPVERFSQRRLAIEAAIAMPLLRLAKMVPAPTGFAHLVPESITPSLVRLWRQDIRLDTTKAASWLQIPYTPLEQALEQTAQWIVTSHSKKAAASQIRSPAMARWEGSGG